VSVPKELHMRWIWMALALALWGCGEASDEDARGGDQVGHCTTDADCPRGLVCEEARCVDDAGLPPETIEPLTFREPAVVDGKLLILSPEAGSVAVLDPATLSIRTLPLPADPVDLAAIPGSDVVAVLSRGARSLSVLDPTTGALQRQALGRAFERLAVAPDGRFALAWSPDGALPLGGAEGVVALVDLQALARGEARPTIERAIGRRHGGVFFRSDAGATLDVAVLAQEELWIFDLDDPAAQPTRLPLPESHTALATRRHAASADGAFWLIGSLTSEELFIADVGARTLAPLLLPGRPSDLDVAADGSRAVLVLRDRSQVAWLALPPGTGPLEVRTVELPGSRCEPAPCTEAPGQATLSADGRKVALFGNARPTESFATLDLETGALTVVERLHKVVERVLLSPSGQTALVIHRAEPDSTASYPYERTVDREEGYSTVDLATGRVQLQLTGSLQPRAPVFREAAARIALPLVHAPTRAFRVDAIDTVGLVATPIPLGSEPEFIGPLPGTEASVWGTQTHPTGRLTFVDLVSRSAQTRTGYALHGELER
jgi:hypothetical protein